MIEDLTNKRKCKKIYDYEVFVNDIVHHRHSIPYYHHINLITDEKKALYQINNYIVDLDSLSKKVIICNKQTQKMVIANVRKEFNYNNKMLLRLVEDTSSTVELDQIINLNERGRRWEGCSKEGKPYGYGKEYDEENNLVFEGFVYEYDYSFGNSKYRVGYGIEYYSDLGIIEYEGIYFCNNRFFGISYYRNGEIDLEGYRAIPAGSNNLLSDKDNKKESKWLSCHYQTLSIPNHYLNTDSFTQFRLTSINFVKTVNIGKHCFSKVKTILFSDLPDVKTITINAVTFNNLR